MASQQGISIAIQDTPTSPIRRLTKIVPYREGGFAVLAPYHTARQGLVGKIPVDYNRVGAFFAKYDDMTSFTAEDRVKLSYHSDGFVQFSGENPKKIISGRDPSTGEPRGVAVFSNPLRTPIRSGPSFGLTAWGLEHFDELPPNKPAEVFSEDDFYFRGCDPGSANGWSLEVFILPRWFWSSTRKKSGGYRLSLGFDAFEATRSVMEFHVIPLPGQDVLLAAAISRAGVSFPSPSGYILQGPAERNPDGTGNILAAFYPRDSLPTDRSPPLDYNEVPQQG